METALVRQPRVSPAPPRAGRAIRVALGLTGAVLAASLVLLQPFAASHLFPGRAVSSAAAPAPLPRGDVETSFGGRPIAAPPANQPPPRLAPAAPTPAAAPEPSRAVPGATLASGLSAVAAPPAVDVAPAPDAEPARQAVVARTPATTTPRDPRAAPAPARAAPLMPPGVMPAPALGTAPPPREPLPLETDLIAPGSPPGSPLGSPGAGATAQPGTIPADSVVPRNKPAAADRNG